MGETTSSFTEQFIPKWVNFIERNPVLIICLILILSIGSIFVIKDMLSMSTSTKNMLSEELLWRQLDLEDEKYFPQYLNNLLIVIDAGTPDQAMDSAIELVDELNNDPKYIDEVYFPQLSSYLRQSAFLFLEEEELQDLSDRLAQIQPFLGTLLRDKNLRGLFSMLEDAIKARQDGEDIDISPLLDEINKVFEDQHRYISWQILMQADNKDEPPYREFISLKLIDAEDDPLPGHKALTHIRSVIEKTDAYQHENIKIRLSGGVALSYEELKSVADANIKAIIISFILVALILLLGLGSAWLIFSCLLTLIVGLIMTTAFAAITVGELNLISVAFAVLYIGLGIDFAIHLTLRFREENLTEANNQQAMKATIQHVFRSLLLCAISTAIGFYSFMPTDYQGVAELGWIAGSGMFISIILTFLLLPSLLSLKKQHSFKDKQNIKNNSLLIKFSEIPYNHPKTIVTISLLLGIFILLQLNKINFDNNTLNLQNPENESVQTYRDLLADSDTSPWSSILLKQTEQETINTINRLQNLSVVEDIVWVNELVPGNQDDKLFIIDDMNLFMGQVDSKSNANLPLQDEIIESINSLSQIITQSNDKEIQSNLDRLNLHLNKLLESNPDMNVLDQLQNRMLKNLDGRLESLSDALKAEEVSISDIPKEILRRWVNKDIYRIKINPSKDLNDNLAMKEFVETLQNEDERIIGSSVINVEASKAVVKAFKSAFTYSFIAITILLILLVSSKLDAIIILSSVLIGALFTCGLMLLFEVPLNFANIIGLPLLLGIGVDSGIHITERFRQEKNKNIYMTSSSRGVIVSSLTTISSISSLAFSAHAGTASMGLLLTIGLASMMVSTMIVLPALLIWRRAREEVV